MPPHIKRCPTKTKVNRLLNAKAGNTRLLFLFANADYNKAMLDIKFIRENPELIREAVRKKHLSFDTAKLLDSDTKYRALLREVEALRSQHNRESGMVAESAGDDRDQRIAQLRVFKSQLGQKEEELKIAEEKRRALLLMVPNVPDPSVPEGETDADNKEIRRWGEAPHFDFLVKDHTTIMRDLDMVDFKRGAVVSGFRGYFLKNDGAMLAAALWLFTLDFLVKKGFVPFIAPSLVREENLVGTAWLPQGKEEVYQTQDALFLSGTAEVPMMGFHQGEIFEEDALPKRYVAFSPCFRREAGSYGKDTKGMFRVHEFMKVEQIVLCRADHEESVRWHEEITKNAEELMRTLHLPHRVVINAAGDMGLGQVKKYDIETWLPSENRYRETHSSSYFHDFQTRRLNIRYRGRDGNTRFAHSLNNTAIATPRILTMIVELFQQADGAVRVPEALRRYMGKDVITKPN